jgi:NitT/TauT family transport system substrate-binding protein
MLQPLLRKWLQAAASFAAGYSFAPAVARVLRLDAYRVSRLNYRAKPKGLQMGRRMRLRGVTVLLAAAALAWAALATARQAAAEAVNFGTDWKAEAEHGGYYQAIAKGIYQKHGLEVNLRPGGPQVNHAQLLAAGVLDFNIASNSFVPLNFVQQKIPMVTVAAIFQKDPSVLIAHPGQGDDTLATLKGKPIMIGSDTRVTAWQFLKQKFGYTDDQIRPYTFSAAPFLADPTAIQQGYLTSEPFVIEQQGVKPVVLLLADAGYGSYGALIETSQKLAQEKPELVQRFVDASIEGWYSYLYDDPAPANNLIKKDNPEMTDALLAYGRDKMKEYGVIDSGDAKQSGIGAMTEARWRDFFETMVKAGLYPADLDFRKAYTLRFVNKKAGMRP